MIQSRSKKQRASRKADLAATAASSSTLTFPKKRFVGIAAKHLAKEKQKFLTMDPCLICGRSPSELDHISTQGASGPDEPFNLWALCHKHHVERHKAGILTLIHRYPGLLLELKAKGWELIWGQLYHVRITELFAQLNQIGVK